MPQSGKLLVNFASKSHAIQLCAINHQTFKKKENTIRLRVKNAQSSRNCRRNLAATRNTLQTVRFRRVMLSFSAKALDALRIVSTSKVLIGNTWICNSIISRVTSWHLFHCKSVFVPENGSLGLCYETQIFNNRSRINRGYTLLLLIFSLISSRFTFHWAIFHPLLPFV